MWIPLGRWCFSLWASVLDSLSVSCWFLAILNNFRSTLNSVLTMACFRSTVFLLETETMSNYHLSRDKQIAVTAALAEGSSIRSIERITGIHRDTIMRLGVRIGQG